MWNCSPQNLLMKKEEEILGLQQMVDLLEDNRREKDKIIKKFEKKLDSLSQQVQAIWRMQEQRKDLGSSLLAKESLDKKISYSLTMRAM